MQTGISPLKERGVRINRQPDNTSSLFETARPDSKRTDILVYALLAALFVFRLVYAGFLGLLPDEAYYWEWSRSPAFGYFDHPPMIAWFIALSRALFGDTVLGVRFLMCGAALGASVASYLLLKKFVRTAFPLITWAVLSNVILLFGVGSMLATPDIPLVLFWSLSLLAGYKAVFESKTFWWLLLGVLCGLGMLSKYTFVLFPASLVVFIIISRDHRRWIGRWQPWISFAIGALVWMPNLVWNHRHHWESILFQLQHGVDSHAALHFDLLGEFVAGQLGVLSLVPMILLGFALDSILRKKAGGAHALYPVVFFLVPFCFFLLSSLQKKVEANWAAGAYMSGLMLIPIVLEHLDTKKSVFLRRFTVFSIVFAAVTTAAILVEIRVPFLPLAAQNDPGAQARGWKALAGEINMVRTRIDPSHTLPVCANRYQDAALLAFYLPDHPRTFTLNFASRGSQYALWPERRPPVAAKVIFLHSTDDPNLTNLCEKNFSSYALWDKVNLYQGPKEIVAWGILTGTLR